MSEEQREPYYSIRVRIGDITSPKDLIGLKERTIEITIGNTTKAIIFRNKEDVADVKDQTLKEMLLDTFKQTDEVAKERNFSFLDKSQEKTS